MPRSVEDDLAMMPDAIQTPDQGEPLVITPEDREEALAEKEDAQEAKGEKERGPDGRWKERHKERQVVRKNAIKENEEFRQTTASLAAQIKSMEERSSRDREAILAALSARQGGQQSQQQTPEVTALNEQIAQTGQLMKAELAKIANGGPEDEYYKLADKRTELIADRRAMERGWGKQQQQESGLPPELAARLVQLHQEFPELAGHQQWNAVAKSFREGLLASKHPDSLTTDRLAVQMAAQQLGIGPRAAPPSQRTRQAYGGPPSGGRTNGAAPRAVQIPRNLIAGSGLTPQQLAEIDWDE